MNSKGSLRPVPGLSIGRNRAHDNQHGGLPGAQDAGNNSRLAGGPADNCAAAQGGFVDVDNVDGAVW